MGAFSGKTVLILGGSRGIGSLSYVVFVTDGPCTIHLCGVKDAAKRLARDWSDSSITDSADRDAVIDVVRKSGALDILVVNAGIGVFGEALELNADDIDRLFKINIHAPYHASVEAAPADARRRAHLNHRLVNGDRLPVAGIAAYAASKSALQGMARGLARDFGPHGITINVVRQGQLIPTLIPPTANARMLHRFMAIKRHGQSEEVAGMVAWLAGPEASFVTGAMHTIDGAFGANRLR
ncbi:SDR family oxidoreductase [Escherichia coli]